MKNTRFIFFTIGFISSFLAQSVCCFSEDEEGQSSSLPLTTPLINSIASEDIPEIRKLIAQNTNLVGPNKDLWTPLHVAAERENSKIHKIIFTALKAKSSSDWYKPLLARNNEQNTPLHVAAYRGNTLFIQEAIEQEMPLGTIKMLTGKDGNSLVHAAVAAGHKETVLFLLNKFMEESERYDINMKNINRCSTLELSIQEGKEDVIETFIKFSGSKRKLDLCNIMRIAVDSRKINTLCKLISIIKEYLRSLENELGDRDWLRLSIASAQYNLGVMYANGYGIAQDYKKAVKFYQKASRQNYAPAQISLGYMYENGKGVSKDDEKAVECYQEAANQSYIFAQYRLGMMYENGQGVKISAVKAADCYRKASNQGYTPAQSRLKEMNENGQGVKPSDKEAVDSYHISNQGYYSAKNNLLMTYENGERTLKDEIKAIEYNQEVIVQKHIPDNFMFGEWYENDVPNNELECVKYHLKDANQCYIPAQNNLEVTFENSESTSNKDEEPIKWYRRATTYGYVFAQQAFGWVYGMVIDNRVLSQF